MSSVNSYHLKIDPWYVMRCAIWYHLYNFKNVKNTHGGVLLLVPNCATHDILSCHFQVTAIRIPLLENFGKCIVVFFTLMYLLNHRNCENIWGDISRDAERTWLQLINVYRKVEISLRKIYSKKDSNEI